MRQALKYNRTNQNSLFTGFTANHPLSPVFNFLILLKNMFMVEYQHFIINGETLLNRPDPISIDRKTILIDRKTFLIDRKTILIHRKTFLIDRETILIHRKTILIHRKTISIDRKTFLIHRKTILIHRKTFLIHRKTTLIRPGIFRTNHNLQLLRNKAFTSGSEASIFVCTLFQKWNKAFPIDKVKIPQWNYTLLTGEEGIIIN